MWFNSSKANKTNHYEVEHPVYTKRRDMTNALFLMGLSCHITLHTVRTIFLTIMCFNGFHCLLLCCVALRHIRCTHFDSPRMHEINQELFKFYLSKLNKNTKLSNKNLLVYIPMLIYKQLIKDVIFKM